MYRENRVEILREVIIIFSKIFIFLDEKKNWEICGKIMCFFF